MEAAGLSLCGGVEERRGYQREIDIWKREVGEGSGRRGEGNGKSH